MHMISYPYRYGILKHTFKVREVLDLLGGGATAELAGEDALGVVEHHHLVICASEWAMIK
jgi:hypothetical protein